MEAPQLITIILMALGVGLEVASHGKPRTGNHNAVVHLVSTGLTVGLLYWGGFFG